MGACFFILLREPRLVPRRLSVPRMPLAQLSLYVYVALMVSSRVLLLRRGALPLLHLK